MPPSPSGGVTIWRIKCTTCKTCSRSRLRPTVARDALLATRAGLRLELCAVIGHIAPMALYRLACALGPHRLVTVLTRGGLPLPVYFQAAAKHRHCLAEYVSLPTIVRGRVSWRLGYTEEASAAAVTQSDGEFHCAACYHEPSSRVRGLLTDGFDSTNEGMRTLFPAARLGHCLRPALTKLPKTLVAIASPVRKALRMPFHTLLDRARQRQGLRVFALGQRWHRCVDHVATSAGVANDERVRHWRWEKTAGWSAVLEDAQMPVASTR